MGGAICCTEREGCRGESVPITLDQLAGIELPGGQTGQDSITTRLKANGMDDKSACGKREMFRRAAKLLQKEGVNPTSFASAFWVPGRIEVAGKHTDYAGGRSLLAAVTKGFAVVSVARDDDVCRIFTTMSSKYSLRRTSSGLNEAPEPESVEIKISSVSEEGGLLAHEGRWSKYNAVAVRRLAKNFGIKHGADIALQCDLPESSGMSSSSAVICYMWLVLSERNNITESTIFKQELSTDEQLFSYLGFIENGQNCGPKLIGDSGVGTFGGSEDHTAIMSSEAGKLKMFSYCPTKHEGTYAFPENWTFVIAVSGALAEKTGDAKEDYNNASFQARDAAAAWCKGARKTLKGTFVPGKANLAEVIASVRESLGGDKADLNAVRQTISSTISQHDDGKTFAPSGEVTRSWFGSGPDCYKSGVLKRRFEQFFDESEVYVRGLAEAFEAKDEEKACEISKNSHRQTVDNLRNTIPETEWLPQEACRLGAIGASAFGAGFGGSCWAAVKDENADTFSKEWKEAYVNKFPKWKESCEFILMKPGPGAFSLH